MVVCKIESKLREEAAEKWGGRKSFSTTSEDGGRKNDVDKYNERLWRNSDADEKQKQHQKKKKF